MTDHDITSRANPRIKAAARLRDRKVRDLEGRILVEGRREVSRAAESGVIVEDVFCCPELCDVAAARAMFPVPAPGPFRWWSVSAEVFDKLAYGDRGEGIVAVAKRPDATLETLNFGLGLPTNPRPPEKEQREGKPELDQASYPSPPGRGQDEGESKLGRSLSPTVSPSEREPIGLIAVLEGIEKPGNVGAILRSADGAGVSAVIVCGGGTDLFNPNAIRASLGTIFTMPVAQATAEETLAWLRAHAFTIVAARPDAGVLYSQFDWTRPTAVVLGSESRGISELWNAPDVASIHLPMRGAADSLNVSATAAVVFYEAGKHRG